MAANMTPESDFCFYMAGRFGDLQKPGNTDCLRLSKLAEKRRWSPYERVRQYPFAQSTLFDHAAFSAEHNALSGFAPYEALDTQQKTRVDRERHQLEISELLHGEVLAMLISAQLVTLLSDTEAKNFAATQTADEARHVSFFRQYLSEHKLAVAPPSERLHQLSVWTLQDSCWEHKILCCQIVIESLALAQFAWLKNTNIPPALRDGLDRILEDEARHVKFGVVILDDYFRNLAPHQQEQWATYVMDTVMSLSPSDNHLIQLASSWHWDTHLLRHHLRRRRMQYPALYRARFRQLSLNLRKIGLLTPGAEARLQRFVGKAESDEPYP